MADEPVNVPPPETPEETPERKAPPWFTWGAALAGKQIADLIAAYDRRTRVLAGIGDNLLTLAKAMGAPHRGQAEVEALADGLVRKSREALAPQPPPGAGRAERPAQRSAPADGPPAGWRDPGASGGRSRSKSAGKGGRTPTPPGQILEKIRKGLEPFGSVPFDSFSEEVLWEVPGRWVRLDSAAGKTWGQWLFDVQALDYAWWRVRKQVMDELDVGAWEEVPRTGNHWKWWTWSGQYRREGQIALWLLTHRERLKGIYEAGPPITGDHDDVPEN